MERAGVVTSAEADQFMISARQALSAWQWEIDRAHGEAKALAERFRRKLDS